MNIVTHTSPITLYSLPMERVDEMRSILHAHPDTKPGAVVSIFVTLALREMKRRYFSNCPELHRMSPESRKREQVLLNLEYLREHGVTTEYPVEELTP